MLHRLTLRVLPRLALAVTQDEVRRRKRVVMLLPGLVAFALYRLAHRLLPLSDPYVLLAVSGALSAATALVCYRYGRGGSWPGLWREDGARRLGWVAGWVGFAYGVQLALMVLALLKIVVRYDFLAHPDGPAMMAVIIAATSVARDAFEIGHVRRLQRGGERVLTFPDGAALRALLGERPGPSLRLAAVGAGLALLAALVARLAEVGRTDLGQLIVVTLAAGSVTLAAYLAGARRSGGWRAAVAAAGWGELFRFWWWPGLAFAATYYLALAGAALFLLRSGEGAPAPQACAAALVGGLMALYGHFLGHRRLVENRIEQTVPESLLRCPFVLGILSRSPGNGAPGGAAVATGEVMAGGSGRRS